MRDDTRREVAEKLRFALRAVRAAQMAAEADPDGGRVARLAWAAVRELEMILAEAMGEREEANR